MIKKNGARRLGVVMDPIQSINFKKDTTLEMLLQAQGRGWELYYMEQNDLFVRDGVNYILVSKVADDLGIVNLTHEEYGIQPFGK